MSGKKKVRFIPSKFKSLYSLKWNHIFIISIPHGKDITIAKILEFARTKWPIDKYLPDLKKDWFPPREYVCNISKQALWLILMYIHTLILKELESWIEKKMEKREEAFIEKKELKMAVSSESKELFDSAGVISTKILFFLLTIRVKWKVLWTS